MTLVSHYLPNMSGPRSSASKDAVRRSATSSSGAVTSPRSDIKLCQSQTSSASTSTTKATSSRSSMSSPVSASPRSSISASSGPARPSASPTAVGAGGNELTTNKSAVSTVRASRPNSAPETKNKSASGSSSVTSRASINKTVEMTKSPAAKLSPTPLPRQQVAAPVAPSRGKVQSATTAMASHVRAKPTSSVNRTVDGRTVTRPENGTGFKSRDVGKVLSNRVSALDCNSVQAAAAATGRKVSGHADTRDSASCTVLPYNNNMQGTSATEIRQKCSDSAAIEARQTQCTSELSVEPQQRGTEEADQVAMISACTSTSPSPPDTTVAPPNNVEQGPVQTNASQCLRGALDSDKDRIETQQIIAEMCSEHSGDATASAASELDAPSVVQNCCGNGSSAERELMTSNGQPTDSSKQADSVPAAAAAAAATTNWYPDCVQSNAADDLTCISEDESIATASYRSQTYSTTVSTIVDDDGVTDAYERTHHDFVTTPVDGNYFTVVPRDRGSPKPTDNDSVLGSSSATSSGERLDGDGSDSCVSSNANNEHVEKRICEIAAELSERDSTYVNITRKSRDVTYVEDIDEKITRLESICDRLTRENSALSDLLAAKKVECVETRQWYRGRVKDLEDDVSRLKMEKCRLLDRLQLPESERASLTAEENALSELRIKLEDAEDRLETARAENAELRQDLRDAELAMQELHDQFQAEESLELRELQRELENTSRDCRLLHFKVCLSNSVLEILDCSV